MNEHGICAKCKKSVGCPYADDRITGCKKFVFDELQLTEKEWIRQASAEELAEFMWRYTHDLITDWEHVNDPMFRQLPLKNILGDNCTKKDSWVEWLKQPHTIKEKHDDNL